MMKMLSSIEKGRDPVNDVCRPCVGNGQGSLNISCPSCPGLRDIAQNCGSCTGAPPAHCVLPQIAISSGIIASALPGKPSGIEPSNWVPFPASNSCPSGRQRPAGYAGLSALPSRMSCLW